MKCWPPSNNAPHRVVDQCPDKETAWPFPLTSASCKCSAGFQVPFRLHSAQFASLNTIHRTTIRAYSKGASSVNLKGLQVNDRIVKPRTRGLTWCIDDGMPIGAFRDVISSYHRIIDGVKFGWGTALVTDGIDEKMAVLREYNVQYAFGGTLFEAYWIQDSVDRFVDLIVQSHCPVVEVSDGTIYLPMNERRRLIQDLKRYAQVFSEVGSKDPEESANWSASDWIRLIDRDLESGADMIILETRESGTAGLCLPNGEIRSDLSDGILSSPLNPSDLMFEAANKTHQTYWIQKLGSNVNLSNVPLSGVINLETLRLGLRSDTFSLLTPSSLLVP